VGQRPIGLSPEDTDIPMVCGSHTKERGGAKIKLVLTLLVLGSMVFLGVRIFPAYFANYQIEDSMKTEAQFAAAAYPKRTEDMVRAAIWGKVQELGIPAKEDDIVVSMSPQNVDITLNYTVAIDLVVTQWNHDFHNHADNHSI